MCLSYNKTMRSHHPLDKSSKNLSDKLIFKKFMRGCKVLRMDWYVLYECDRGSCLRLGVQKMSLLMQRDPYLLASVNSFP